MTDKHCEYEEHEEEIQNDQPLIESHLNSKVLHMQKQGNFNYLNNINESFYLSISLN